MSKEEARRLAHSCPALGMRLLIYEQRLMQCGLVAIMTQVRCRYEDWQHVRAHLRPVRHLPQRLRCWQRRHLSLLLDPAAAPEPASKNREACMKQPVGLMRLMQKLRTLVVCKLLDSLPPVEDSIRPTSAGAAVLAHFGAGMRMVQNRAAVLWQLQAGQATGPVPRVHEPVQTSHTLSIADWVPWQATVFVCWLQSRPHCGLAQADVPGCRQNEHLHRIHVPDPGWSWKCRTLDRQECYCLPVLLGG
jgi:hypothetical protein